MIKSIAIVALLICSSAPLLGGQQPVAAQVEVGPSPLYFGSVGLASAATRSVTLTNLGPSPLTIASGYPIILGNHANDFGVTGNDCGGYVPAGHRCTIHITFTPALRGTRSAFLKLVHDGNASPQVVTLTGVGQ